MVTTRFIGRLGNSMFQTSAAIGYAKKYGYKWGVPNDQRESTILTHFPHLPRCDETGKRYHEHPPRHCDQHNQHFDDCHFNYHDLPDLGPDVTLTGFFQSWKYFENAQDEVREVFKLKHYPEYENYVSIHVRRGDYLKYAGSFPPVTDDYIFEACNTILGKDIHDEIKGFIFMSDDILWCKEIGNRQLMKPWATEPKTMFGKAVEFSEDRNEYEDLSIMASCSHHIIANSTFSWWGSFLGHNPDKVVVSPSASTWFGPTCGVKQPVVDLILPGWIQINTR